MRGIWERGWEAGRGFLDLPNTGMTREGEREQIQNKTLMTNKITKVGEGLSESG
jgi:hypothetical protein